MDYGTDIKRGWELTDDGDLKLVKDVDNVTQALVNRLKCDLHSLDLYYRDYGSLLSGFLGWKRNQATLDFIKLEVQNRLRADERIESFNVTTELGEKSDSILITMDLELSDDYVHTIQLELSDDGVEEVGN